jgi:hypothetical protein
LKNDAPFLRNSPTLPKKPAATTTKRAYITKKPEAHHAWWLQAVVSAVCFCFFVLILR